MGTVNTKTGLGHLNLGNSGLVRNLKSHMRAKKEKLIQFNSLCLKFDDGIP